MQRSRLPRRVAASDSQESVCAQSTARSWQVDTGNLERRARRLRSWHSVKTSLVRKTQNCNRTHVRDSPGTRGAHYPRLASASADLGRRRRRRMSWAWRPELVPPKFRASYRPLAHAASAARRHRSATSSCARPVCLPVASTNLSRPSSRRCASSNLSVAHRG
jgi:hypothetical protein